MIAINKIQKENVENFRKRIPKTNILAKKNDQNTRTIELENEISDTTVLVTNTNINAKVTKMLVTKSHFNTKVTEIDNKTPVIAYFATKLHRNTKLSDIVNTLIDKTKFNALFNQIYFFRRNILLKF